MQEIIKEKNPRSIKFFGKDVLTILNDLITKLVDQAQASELNPSTAPHLFWHEAYQLFNETLIKHQQDRFVKTLYDKYFNQLFSNVAITEEIASLKEIINKENDAENYVDNKHI